MQVSRNKASLRILPRPQIRDPCSTPLTAAPGTYRSPCVKSCPPPSASASSNMFRRKPREILVTPLLYKGAIGVALGNHRGRLVLNAQEQPFHTTVFPHTPGLQPQGLLTVASIRQLYNFNHHRLTLFLLSTYMCSQACPTEQLFLSFVTQSCFLSSENTLPPCCHSSRPLARVPVHPEFSHLLVYCNHSGLYC